MNKGTKARTKQPARRARRTG